jgi:hypothetical protein
MRREGNRVQLDKADLIRMNQLVRRQVDYEGFRAWYQGLATDEQAALVAELCHCAYQAGVDESVYERACQTAGFTPDDELVLMMKKVQGRGGLNVGGLTEWLGSAQSNTRVRALKLFVYLFGEAEQKVMASEDRQSCNHWWHRNLEDQRVVQSILSDPEYYKTSPRDDDRLPPNRNQSSND